MEKNEVEQDVDLYSSLDAVAHSEGGKILIENLKSDVVNSVESLLSNYKTSDEMLLRSTIAKLQSDLGILRALTRSEKNKKMAEEELKKILAE